MSNDWTLTEPARQEKPKPFIVIYGEPKIGKTTQFTKPDKCILVPTEQGFDLSKPIMRLPANRLAASWDDLLMSVNTLVKEEHDREWVVFDTLNGCVDLCAKHVCQRDFDGQWTAIPGKRGYNSYMEGEKQCAQEFKRLLNGLELLRKKKGMGAIMLAHEGLHRKNSSLGDDFMAVGANISKYSWHTVTAWADQIGHACREFIVSTPENKDKGKAHTISNERQIVFAGGPERDAGTRAGYEMPDKIPLRWSSYSDSLALNFK